MFNAISDRGVDVSDEPEERSYGIDFGIRDPFGNAIRIGQMYENYNTLATEGYEPAQ